jgi:hypothetical protein
MRKITDLEDFPWGIRIIGHLYNGIAALYDGIVTIIHGIRNAIISVLLLKYMFTVLFIEKWDRPMSLLDKYHWYLDEKQGKADWSRALFLGSDNCINGDYVLIAHNYYRLYLLSNELDYFDYDINKIRKYYATIRQNTKTIR